MVLSIPPLKTPVAKPLQMPRLHPLLLDPALVLYCDFSRGPKLFDYSKSGRHGTITGATFVSEGLWGSALRFDGSDDKVSMGTDPIKSGSFSVGAVFMLDDLPSVDGDYHGIVTKLNRSVASTNGEFYLSCPNSTDKATFGGRTNNAWYKVTDPDTISPDIWYQMIGVWDEEKGVETLYKNGTSVNTTDITGLTIPQDSQRTLYIGMTSGAASYYKGLIAEAFIINRALSASEAKALYMARMP